MRLVKTDTKPNALALPQSEVYFASEDVLAAKCGNRLR